MTIDRFTDDLLAQTAQVWEKVHRHPFVRGLGDGSLSVESFRFYMVQDYLFLIEFCRVLALGWRSGQPVPLSQRRRLPKEKDGQ